MHGAQHKHDWIRPTILRLDHVDTTSSGNQFSVTETNGHVQINAYTMTSTVLGPFSYGGPVS